MAKVATPDLKKYLDKQVRVALQGDRQVTGTLRGFDVFLNLVIDSTVEQVHPPAPNGGGGLNQHAWVDASPCGMVVIRGNSVTSIEGLEPVQSRV